MGGFDAEGFCRAVEKTGVNISCPGVVGRISEGFAIPNVGLFNSCAMGNSVGLGLILGCLTTAATFFGMVMNFAFLFSGTTSTNPQMLLLSIFLIVAGANAGKIGLDYYLLPYLRKWKAQMFRTKGRSVRT